MICRRPTYAEVAASFESRVAPAGFDVLGAVNVGAYNRSLTPEHDGFRLPLLRDEQDLVLVVGNTRRLWSLFRDAYATTSLGGEAHPLDTYTGLHIGGAASDVARELELCHAVRYSFDRIPKAVAIQRLAAVSGVAELGPIGLSIHPAHGPWFSLRAAVIFDVEGPVARAPAPTCSACLERPCLIARDEVSRRYGSVFEADNFHVDWRAWLAMRDACPIGRDVRYGDQQIRYHYLKDRSMLDAAVTGATDNPREAPATEHDHRTRR